MQSVEIPRLPLASLERQSVSKKGKDTMELRISLPDQTMYSLTLASSCTGQDCLDEMCDILGVVEKDYFGLQYRDKTYNCNIWINKRLRLRKQLKTKPPHYLLFVVKFYTDVELLLQPSTIDLFYKDLKSQIRHGLTPIPDSKRALIGATIAQAEFGDLKEHSTTNSTGQSSTGGLVYPEYFPNWSNGIALQIAKEHKKLKGVSKADAQSLMLTEVYQVDGFGMQYYSAFLSNEHVVLGVGARYVAIYDSTFSLKKRISFYNITQVSFGYKFFAFTYATREEGTGLPISKKIVFHVHSHTISRSLFRSVTEAQVFLHQTTVSPNVFNHSDQRNARMKRVCEKVFRMHFDTYYYYDIHRTKNESYRYYWQLLNQVQDERSLIYEPAPTSLAYINLSVNVDETEDDSSSQAHDKTALIWGLSTSSSNLAKQLLPESKLKLSHSGSLMTHSPPLAQTSGEGSMSGEEGETSDDTTQPSVKTDLTTTEEPVEPLKGAQSKKFQQLLLKIQDERLCNVCMDELITSVFCPCGHYVACNRCAKKLDKCPVCRHPVAYVQTVYTKY